MATPQPPIEQTYNLDIKKWDPAWVEVTDNTLKAIPGVLKVQANCSQLTEYLYLGNLACARDLELLKEKGITHILTLTKRGLPEEVEAEMKLKQILIKDTPSTRMTDILEIGFKHILDAKEFKGKILVHCRAGVSRGSCCCIAYLMKYHGMPLRAAYAHVKTRRPIVHPNRGFLEQLKEHEVSLRGYMSPAANIRTQELPFTLWERVEALGLSDPIPCLTLSQRMEATLSKAYEARYHSANPYLTLDAGLGGKMELHTVELYWLGDADWIDELIVRTLYTERPPNSNYVSKKRSVC
eukprot:TRINITY_DN21427_c0_g1_i1.p1 TRINITY_DN21427_c0_g1~~TRINITY_DN21427_c0_g1_i1.p1  ORF type:complete len:296 (+),score=33.15 TRINITY_DN21427_c0_g1_i1:97-984(+)